LFPALLQSRRGGETYYLCSREWCQGWIGDYRESRTREFSADATSAKTLGAAQPMINALVKLDSVGKQIPLDASPSMSHMYIMKPFSGGSFFKLFSTYPPTEERIAALRAIGSL
jgi:Zn-dependent protease with chaperone function